MSMLYYVADALNTTLHKMKTGEVIGKEVRQINCGPWRVPVVVDVKSDFIQAARGTFWVTIDALRCYVVISDADLKNPEKKTLWFVILDQKKYETMVAGTEPAFIADTINGRLAELKPIVKEVFQWNEKTLWTVAPQKKAS